MTKPLHILNQMGVLSSFSVSKKISEREIKKIISKNKHGSERGMEILKETVLNEIQNAIKAGKIPGLIGHEVIVNEMEKNKQINDEMSDINRILNLVSNKLKSKKYDKMTLCYFINSLVNLLNLTEKDFSEFHNQQDDIDEDSEDESGNVI